MRRAFVRYLTTSLSNRQQSTTTSWTTKLQISNPANSIQAPIFRLLGSEGQLLVDDNGNAKSTKLSDERALDLYKKMIKLNVIDQVLFESQRQGRISFYMTSFGEEASIIGSAGALEHEDCVYSQYREAGVLIEREFSLDLMLAQCFGNKNDPGKGRQMPIHYGSRELNFITVSSPLATQMPQAAGHAYALKLGHRKECERLDRIVVCYFGEGAASEGDAHAAMNFAATLRCPVLFFCRNNQWAISTPSSEQYVGEGVAARAQGYGMASLRVDGNDLFAVYEATRAAREFALERSEPILLEAFTYRIGHHSTSDDSTTYRDAQDLKRRELSDDHPLRRISKYLRQRGLWCDQREEGERKQVRAELLSALNRAGQVKKAAVLSMFDDVYGGQMPANLERQRAELRDHLNRFGSYYPVGEHDGI